MSCKVCPDYAKDYKNEFLLLRGIDNCFKYFLRNMCWVDIGIHKSPKVERINKLIDRFEINQQYYNLDTSPKEIDRCDIGTAIYLSEELH